jgi:hypothetical protein
MHIYAFFNVGREGKVVPKHDATFLKNQKTIVAD